MTCLICLNTKKPVMLVKIDSCIWYDVMRRSYLIKLPFKKSIRVPDEICRSHRPIRLNHKTYEFYNDYVLIDKIRVNL